MGHTYTHTERTWRRHGQNFAQLKFKCCTNLCHVPCGMCEGSQNDGDNDDDNGDDDDDDDRDNA